MRWRLRLSPAPACTCMPDARRMRCNPLLSRPHAVRAAAWDPEHVPPQCNIQLHVKLRTYWPLRSSMHAVHLQAEAIGGGAAAEGCLCAQKGGGECEGGRAQSNARRRGGQGGQSAASTTVGPSCMLCRRQRSLGLPGSSLCMISSPIEETSNRQRTREATSLHRWWKPDCPSPSASTGPRSLAPACS